MALGCGFEIVIKIVQYQNPESFFYILFKVKILMSV